MPKIAFYTLGCKLNFSETSTLGRMFEDKGFEKVDFHERADIYVINTCSVTDNADKKCKKVVKEALKHNSEAYIAIVGCYAQLKPKEISEIPGVDIVLGAAEKFNLPEHLMDWDKKDRKTIVYNGEISDVKTFVSAYSAGDRTRTFLKVQDGCDYTCAFCTIPLARGHSRSDTIDNVVLNAQAIANQGTKEIVLTGVNIGDFGAEKHDFLKLIQRLDALESIDRFRISSIEPNLLTDEIIAFVAKSQRFVPHFHIPLQSGNDKTLAAMRRRYKSDLYRSRVADIKQLMPHCCIGVDVIVGFPGETDEDFKSTYDFINSLDISYLHVFTYSERENTLAATMDGVVPNAERAHRSKLLHQLSDEKRLKFYKNHLDETHSVLFEAEQSGGMIYGFTENYIKVTAKYDPILVNEVKTVTLLAINEEGVVEVEESVPFSSKSI